MKVFIFKIEKEITTGNFNHEKGLEKITEILRLMDHNEKDPSKPKNKDKLMELIYEVLKKAKCKICLIILLASGTRRSLGFFNRIMM